MTRNDSTMSLDELQSIDDLRIKKLQPLLPPSILLDEVPMTTEIEATVVAGRQAVTKAITGKDDRLIVIVGPCSIHDTKAGMEYAEKLKAMADEFKRDLIIVMRVYFEKPRTIVGWKGLINDPDLNGTFKINQGLRQARGFLAKVNELGLPTGCEFLDTISPQFFADLVSWGAIGARTTESQIHRELSSGLSMPVGFKNSTSGDIQIACDAVQSSKHPHTFLSVTKQGLSAIVHTTGNPFCTIILRGSSTGTNYDKESVTKCVEGLKKRNVQYPKVIIDCSHGNSSKLCKNQPKVAEAVSAQLADGSYDIAGVMIESFIEEGNQKLPSPPGENPRETLVFGKSITDECIDLATTYEVLKNLSNGVRQRRKRKFDDQ
eukprot:TRINITY_DN13929_c0_g1_i1.p1 TRINITY_DN13929_c0_g1~~TRINITY_DN13929_c0_g1_i1.p1  ORF type:complete len:376 (+),score=76.51 TRINITY_DN13929_c0_g1_i1:73-1200(+)